MSCKDQVYPTGKVIGQNERGAADHFSVHMVCKCFATSLVNETGRRWNVLHHVSELTLKGKKQQRVGAYCLFHNWSVPFPNSVDIPFPKVYNTNSHEKKSSSGNVYQRDQSCYDSSELEPCNTERQLKALDSYFSKLSDDTVEQLSSCMSTSNPDTLSNEKECKSSSQYEGKMTDMIEATGGYKTKTGLSSLKNYFDKLNTVNETGRRWNVLHHVSELTLKGKKQQRVGAYCLFHNWSVPFPNSVDIPFPKVYNTNSHEKKSSSGNVYQRNQSCYDSSELEPCNTERQLKALDSYFSKLSDDMVEQLSSCMSTSNPDTLSNEKKCKSSSQYEGKMTDMIEATGGYKTKTGLSSLKNYFDKLNTEIGTRKGTSISDKEASAGNSIRPPDSVIGEYNEKEGTIAKPDLKKQFESMDNQTDPGIFGKDNVEGLQTNDEASDLFQMLPEWYSMNGTVLFRASCSFLALVYSVLHSGFLHVALGCWVLLTFGPQVCRGYGPFTFFLIYILGGICGNFTSFIHTPELTVCGTGPVFAIIGAWLVYQTQNKEVTDKEVSESMFRKAVIATALSFVLSSFGRIDDWTHVGAIISGVVFGYFTCPGLELDDLSSENGQKEGIALGPVFAIIGAWLVYQTQNKEVTDKEVSESMFRKAVIATALSFVLSSFGRIDDWTHVGAIISGVVFGYFTCPGLELDDLSSENGQKEGIALVRRKANPCKSLITFTIFVLVLVSLVLFYEPELEMLEVDGLV
ncbi:putative RHOMBOID-like protein 9, chloroplastic [Cocos nucifera]|uniref:Putative RHOMBOID-like protein 9, chloroplastic n=1 Tax=Cocos nucifera TaxID=13894 RepID=A0A8K0I2Q7_COCNU|nr:putative RHOMBOID-like protein 9, chloroplastic [Cocos nucifera]